MRASNVSTVVICLMVLGMTFQGLQFTMAPVSAQEQGKWDHLDLSNAKVTGDFVRIAPDKALITKKAYSGPVEITVVARTDQDNIRLLAFKGGIVIFNWEGQPGDLRIHRPDDLKKQAVGSVAVSKQFPLKPDTWYKLRWKITEDWMEVAVNDRVVFAEQRTFDLSKAVPVKVSSAFGSVVDVKSFEVTPIPGSSPLLKHAGQVTHITANSDGDGVLTVGQKGLLAWDTAGSKLTRTIINKDLTNISLRIASDGKRLVTTNDTETATWDLTLGKVVRTSAKVGTFGTGWINPDGKFAVLLNRTDMSIVDLDADKEIGRIEHPKSDRWMPEFSPDGKRMVLPVRGQIKEFDLATAKHVRSYELGDSFPQIAFSPDNRLLASVAADGVRLWDSGTGKQVQCVNHDGLLPAYCAFSPNGKFLVTASNDGRVIVWDAASWKKLFQVVNKGNDEIVMSRDGKIATRTASESRVAVHEVGSGKELLVFNYETSITGKMVFSRDGQKLLIGMATGLLAIPVPPAPAEEAIVNAGPKTLWAWATIGSEKMFLSVGFSPDGKRIAGWCGDSIQIWDVAAKKALTKISIPADDVDFTVIPWSNVAFSPDGKQIAASIRSIKVWDSETGKELKSIEGNYVTLAFRPDGKWIAGVEANNDVVCWDLATGKDVCALRAKRDTSAIAFSHDGKMLGAGGNSFVKVWEVESRKELLNVELNVKWVRKVAFSPDNKMLAAVMSGEAKGFVMLWDLSTGKVIRTMKCSTQGVHDLAFSPDGKSVVSVGFGETLPGLSAAQVWETETGRLKYLLDTGPTNRYSVAISPVITKADTSAPYLGVATGPIDGGVVVTGVVPDSPAEKFGLNVGDKIARVADDPVTVETFVQTLAKYKAGDAVLLTVDRDKKRIPLRVVLGTRPGGRIVALGGVGSPIRLLMVPE